jgi:glycosyltransferase involved in cell wall biosynthesis
MKMIIIDNSDSGNICQKYLNNICSSVTTVYRFNRNLGHAFGLNFAILKATTDYLLIMDSDTQMIKSPVKKMLRLMDNETYGVGWITEIGKDGYDFGTWNHHKIPIKYLHPYFCIINRNWFYRFPPFVHHGAPWYKAANALHNSDQLWRIKSFPGLTGHTEGRGANWVGTPCEYVLHPYGGTRMQLKKEGREEIEGKWEL